MFRRDGLFLVLLALGAMTISGCGKPPPRQPLAGAASGAISISARAIDIAQLQKVKPGMTVAQVEEILGPGEVVEPERTIPPGELIAIAGKSDKPRTYKSLQWKVIINGEPYRVMLPFIDGTSPVSYAHTVKKLTDYFGVHLGH